MKTLTEIKDIEKYLFGKLRPSSKLVFEARMLINPDLRHRVEWQQKLYAIITLSGRRKIKFEAERIHRRLFTDPAKKDFQKNVYQLFLKK